MGLMSTGPGTGPAVRKPGSSDLEAGMAGDVAELAGVEVSERLLNLRLGVHDERSAHGNRLADRQAAVSHHHAQFVAVARGHVDRRDRGLRYGVGPGDLP